MSTLKWGAFDLNLLVVFDAVMQERSVTLAGNRLGLSQPAISHALGRLRHMLKDELFIRSPTGMVPTPRAELLALPIRQALEELRHSFEPVQFDPSKAVRRFSISVDNAAAILVVAPLASRIVKIAPGVTLGFRPSGTLNLPSLLDQGEIDLAIGSFAEQAERFSRQVLLHDDYVVVLRKNHPLAGSGKFSIRTFAELPHLDFSSADHATDFVDHALAEHKLKRCIGLRAPFLSAERMLVSSDMISIVRRRIAKELVRGRALVFRPLPFQSPVVQTTMIWHRRFDRQPAHLWLRGVAAELCRHLRE